MTIYVLMGIIIIIFGHIISLFGNISSEGRTKKNYIAWITVMFILICGFRSPIVGHDTIRYINAFYAVGKFPFQDMLAYSIAYKSPLYAIFVWLVYRTTHSHQILLFLVAIIHFSLVGRFIYKNTKDPITAMFIYLCMFFTFQLTGLRQSLAIAILFIAYEQIKEKKLLKFFLWMIVAALIHYTVLIFLMAYICLEIKPNKTRTIVFLLAIPFVFLFRIQLTTFLKGISGFEDYGIYLSFPLTSIVMMYLITFMALILQNDILKRNPVANHAINAMIIASLMMPMVIINPSALRVVKYYSVFMVILIPEIIKSIDNKVNASNTVFKALIYLTSSDRISRFILRYNSIVLKFLIYTILIVLFMLSLGKDSVYTYSFFWADILIK